MAITVCGNCIEFGSCTMCSTPTGVTFVGSICAPAGFSDARGLPGSISGYLAGGERDTPPGGENNTIEKFSFASDSNGVDVGDLVVDVRNSAGQSSEVSGYVTGNSLSSDKSDMNKFPFSSDTNATDVGEVVGGLYRAAGASSLVFGKGYLAGGSFRPGPSPAVNVRSIQTFPFAADEPATLGASLSIAVRLAAGHSSATNGYTSAGCNPSNRVDAILKYPFANDADATEIGQLAEAKSEHMGQSSITHGYASGGQSNTPPVPSINAGNCIEKFPFSSDASSTEIGTLTQARESGAGQSSVTSGYTTGGTKLPPGLSDTIDKFPFASDTSATDVGELVDGYGDKPSGHQI